MLSQSITNLTNGTQLILQNVQWLRFWVTLERVYKKTERNDWKSVECPDLEICGDY